MKKVGIFCILGRIRTLFSTKRIQGSIAVSKWKGSGFSLSKHGFAISSTLLIVSCIFSSPWSFSSPCFFLPMCIMYNTLHMSHKGIMTSLKYSWYYITVSSVVFKLKKTCVWKIWKLSLTNYFFLCEFDLLCNWLWFAYCDLADVYFILLRY